RVGVQPFEQRGRVGSDHLHLGEMDVRINEARQDEMGPMVDHLDIGSVAAPEIADASDLAVLDLDDAVLPIAVGGGIVARLRLLAKGEDAPAQRPAAHRAVPSRNHATIRSRSSCVMSVRLPGGMAWL